MKWGFSSEFTSQCPLYFLFLNCRLNCRLNNFVLPNLLHSSLVCGALGSPFNVHHEHHYSPSQGYAECKLRLSWLLHCGVVKWCMSRLRHWASILSRSLPSEMYCSILPHRGRYYVINCLLWVLAVLLYFYINIDSLPGWLLHPEQCLRIP